VTAGETFTVMIDDASDLGAFEFELFYIPAIVTVEDVTVGEFLGSTGRAVIPLGPRIDNQAGRTIFGAFTLGLQPVPSGAGVRYRGGFGPRNMRKATKDAKDFRGFRAL
jgi:hypothetical protein